MLIADDLISPGGPSAPVWAFLTAIISIALTILGTQLKARSDFKQLREQTELAKNAAQKANASASQAQANTANVSNGFASAVLGKLERIEQSQQSAEEALRKHLQWHLDNDRK